MQNAAGFFPIGPITNKWWLALYVFAVLVISTLVLPWLLTRTWLSGWIQGWPTFNETGQIGDTIGGIANPVIAFMAVLFAGAAFWLQYVAHVNQKELDKLHKFEERFYRMLEVHRENTARIENEYTFKDLYAQYMLLYKTVEEVYDTAYTEVANSSDFTNMVLLSPYEEGEKKKELICKIAYGYYFYGFDFAISMNRDKPEYWLLLHITSKIQYKYNLTQEGKPGITFNATYSIVAKAVDETLKDYAKKLEAALIPKNEMLGMYYRQLFQITKFVDESCLSEFEDKYEYMKQLRANMSDFAQIMVSTQLLVLPY